MSSGLGSLLDASDFDMWDRPEVRSFDLPLFKTIPKALNDLGFLAGATSEDKIILLKFYAVPMHK